MKDIKFKLILIILICSLVLVVGCSKTESGIPQKEKILEKNIELTPAKQAYQIGIDTEVQLTIRNNEEKYLYIISDCYGDYAQVENNGKLLELHDITAVQTLRCDTNVEKIAPKQEKTIKVWDLKHYKDGKVTNAEVGDYFIILKNVILTDDLKEESRTDLIFEVQNILNKEEEVRELQIGIKVELPAHS